MTFRESIKKAWHRFSLKQRIVIISLSLIIIISFLVGGLNFLNAWRENNFRNEEIRLEKQRVEAREKAADEALKKAAELAAAILEKETELKNLEEKRNEKQLELDNVSKSARDAVDNVDRVRRNPRADNPSAVSLCAELAELGYPCR